MPNSSSTQSSDGDNFKRIFLNGIIGDNPILKLVLGMCSTLAITTLALNGLVMGISTMFVLISSELATSLIRNVVPSRVRIPVYIVVVATFVTIIDLLLHAFLPQTHKLLGVFIPLIVVNCIIFARVEAFSSKNSALMSLIDGFGMGIGYTTVLVVLSSIRELLAFGTIFGIKILPWLDPLVVMAMPAGAFITLALLMALMNKLTIKSESTKKDGVCHVQ
jgi:Na+-translocating ferredoxin:NAD+ oxidoreductase subunit E